MFTKNILEMDAAQARRKATEVNNKETDSQYTSIIKMIEDAVSKGEFEVGVYNIPIKQEVKNKLTLQGYTIHKPMSDRNETYTKISW